MELKGSQTEKNLMTAFAGESEARNKYTYFASQARKEGYLQIAAIFEETANQEKEHAKREFKFLEPKAVPPCMDNQLPIVVFKLSEPGNIIKVLMGEEVGSVIGELPA